MRVEKSILVSARNMRDKRRSYQERERDLRLKNFGFTSSVHGMGRTRGKGHETGGAAATLALERGGIGGDRRKRPWRRDRMAGFKGGKERRVGVTGDSKSMRLTRIKKDIFVKNYMTGDNYFTTSKIKTAVTMVMSRIV